MKTSRPDSDFPIRMRLHGLRLMAAFLMILENGLRAFSPLLLWICVFFVVWMFQIPGMFGQSVEIVSAVVFAAGVCIFLFLGCRRYSHPHHDAVTRRIEEDSGLLHRPLSGLGDRLANPDAQRTEHLWHSWQSQLAPALKMMRWPKPRPVFSSTDPYAVRGLILVALIITLSISGSSWRQRIGHGILPVVPSFATKHGDDVLVWITPPAYTGQPQLVLKGSGGAQPIAIPEGSMIKARVKGGIGRPALKFDHSIFPMDRFGQGNYGIEKSVQNASMLSVRQMIMSRARWPMVYVEDRPPIVTQKGPPIIQPKGEVKIPLVVQDDYGVETVTAHITLDPSVVPPPIGTPVDDVRNVASPPKTAMDFSPQFELAWHPWAGQKVIMDIEAKDHKGQTATIKGLKLTLPERPFRHPLAQKLVSLRKRLIWAPTASAKNVAYEIGMLMSRPVLYQGDPLVFLSLRSIVSHLVYDDGAASVSKVVAQLWDTALRIEDGNFSIAKRDYRKAQSDLQALLRDPNATPAQIAQAMDNLRQAMAGYLNETFRELQKQMAVSGADPNMLNAENFMKAINPETLAGMLDKMQAQAMSNDRNAAQQMMSQMQKMMDGLDPSNIQTEMPKDMQEMARQAGELQKLVEKQKALLDDTKAQDAQQTRKSEKAPSRKIDVEGLKARQETVRQGLIDLMTAAGEKLGKVPDGMGKAEIQMRGSSKSLGDGRVKESFPFQEQAIKDLSDGQKQMSQQLAERMASMMMFSFGQGPTDPLGRPIGDGDKDGNAGMGSKVKIPDHAERKKIQDILDQLRKKSGELSRPDYELDYYRRLMKQF